MTSTIRSLNPWVTCLNPNQARQLRLFCFPYAGGGASIFRTWMNKLPPYIEICSIQLPGRESRLIEEPYHQLAPLVEKIGQALHYYLDVPFAFFGHSMGALVSFELSHLVQQLYGKSPEYLFVSGRHAPHLPDPKPPVHHLPDVEFIAEIRRLNGTSEDVLQNAELMELLLPTLRADVETCETYCYIRREPLDFPLSAFGGREDEEVGYHELAAWGEHTSKTFTMRMLPGDHFFLNSAQSSLLKAILQDLQDR